ncbi:hypothetical protein, partial [Desulfonatronospira sp. MSAO_Bac3]|uniref:hypothetical protein n=1 Tax=Desulfonatronospira sp. MSAO_Bac3 TaxID=2293857 RepID=UPI000FF39E1E
KDDPCPLTDEQLWVVMDHNNCCQYQVDEDGPGEEDGPWAKGWEDRRPPQGFDPWAEDEGVSIDAEEAQRGLR